MLFIRADANEIIGTGHVMRCLSIANEMKKIGEDVTFIFADDRTRAVVEQNLFRGICLNTVWTDLDTEVDKLEKVIEKNQIKFLLIDTYYVTKHYLEKLGKFVKTAYIDDLHTMLYPVDILINYNLYAYHYEYEKKYKAAGYRPVFLLGCDYVPLREEFGNITKKIRDAADKILITSGGTDQYNVIGRLLFELERQKWFFEFDYYVVIGRFNDHFRELKDKYYKYSNVHLLQNIPNISDYMQQCDIAITAGGVTTYELCASGIPSIMYTMADNQLEIAKAVSEQGMIPWAGDIRGDVNACMNSIMENIICLRSDVALRKRRSRKMQETVDGRGCRRLREVLSQWL